ncbi:hypothetical protein TNCV_5024791 [Trichonephila clavipes]|nr:hypothetical protein TNCV_5024791 [Trichonephila clavipes]
MENGFNLGDFRKMKRFDQKAYKLPPPTPAHVPAETNKRPLEQQPGPSSKKNRVFITPVIRPPVLIARPSTALSTPQPVTIPELPELTTSQTTSTSSSRSTPYGQDFGADPYGRLFHGSNHGVRIWRLHATRDSTGSYPRTPGA